MKQTRRGVLGTIGIAATMGIGATQVMGADGLSIKIEIFPKEEYFTLTNTGNSKADISNFYVNVEYNDQTTQDRQLEDNTVLEPNETLKVGTGTKTTVSVQQSLKYKKEMLHNTDPDEIALLNLDKEVVATSDGSLSETTTTSKEDGSDETTSEETTTEEDTTSEEDTDETSSDETTTEKSDDSSSDDDSSDNSDSSDDSSEDAQSGDDSQSDESGDSNSDTSGSEDESSSEESDDDC